MSEGPNGPSLLSQPVAASESGNSRRRRVVLAVVTWRAEALTRECLAGLTRLVDWPVPTLVVDNASGTGEGERLAAEFGEPVSALTRSVNDGVPGGYNAALEWAIEKGASHLLLLNNDVVVTDPRMLERLMAATGRDVAAVGPLVHDPNGAVFSAGGWVDWTRGRGRFWREPVAAEPYEAEWLDGPCLLISTEAASKVGGLASEYFMYWEELDWAVRARRAGFRLLVQPATSITHIRSTRTASMRVRYLMLRNGILFMRRQGTASQNVTSLAWAIFYKSPGILIRCLGRPRDLVRVPGTVGSAFWWNVADAIQCRRWLLPGDGPPLGQRGRPQV
jgi:GT2 family glycosyltransferase